MARHRIHSLALKNRIVQEYAPGATLNAWHDSTTSRAT